MPDTHLKLAKYVRFRAEKFGGVLFETRSEKVFTLNDSAAAVVGEIKTGGDEFEIVQRMTQRFRGVNGTIARESSAFIADLREKRLVEDVHNDRPGKED